MQCAPDSSWVTAPSFPNEVQDHGSTLCDFYQFSWQSFLYLVSPAAVADSEGDRNFQIEAEFPDLQVSGDSCAAGSAGKALFVRTRKPSASTGEFVIPERINEAGSAAATIYDQNGNVVFYDIRFSKDLCTASTTGNLPDETVEIKTAWRVMKSTDDSSRYFTMTADIELDDGNLKEETLGMVGFHLARATPEHPEMVWATFEQVDNVPDCLNPAAAPSSHGWSFTSGTCASCLASSTTGTAGCATDCGSTLNDAAKCTASTTTDNCLTGTATNICRVYEDGTYTGDYEGQENIEDIESINSGMASILGDLSSSNDMSVWDNYRLVGAVWVSDITQPSGDPGAAAATTNQRGSMQLTNSTLETNDQGTLAPDGTQTNANNCFGCHAYTPNKTAEDNPTGRLSHIFDTIVSQRGGS